MQQIRTMKSSLHSTLFFILSFSLWSTSAKADETNDFLLNENIYQTKLIDGSQVTVIESQGANGNVVFQFLKNGVIVDSVVVTTSPPETTSENLSPAEEEAFKALRKETLAAAYTAAEALGPQTIAVAADQKTAAALETKNPDSLQTEKTSFLKKLKKTFITPLVQSFVSMNAKQKKIILQNTEVGFSVHAQISPAATIGRFAFGFLAGLGIDGGYNRVLKKIFLTFYEIHGKVSGGLGIDLNAGIGTGVYFRVKNSETQTENRIEAKGFLQKIVGRVYSKDTRQGQLTNISVPFLALVQEVSENHASIQFQVNASVNPLPSALEVNTKVNAAQFGFTNPMVLFQQGGQKMILSVGSLIESLWAWGTKKQRAATQMISKSISDLPFSSKAPLQCTNVL